MIDQATLSSWAPDVDENNPSQLVDCNQVYPVAKGIRTFSIPVVRASTPKIVFKNPVVGGSQTVREEYYPPVVNAYTCYWRDGLSTAYALTEKVRAAYFAGLNLVGNTAVNGAIFVLNNTEWELKAYVQSADQGSARPNEQTTIPTASINNTFDGENDPAVAWPNTFDMSRVDFGSFAQYGDYCFVATGNSLTYFTFAEKNTPKQRLSSGSKDVAPKFVAQAGDFIFQANSTANADDDKGIVMDSMYWICSAAGVVDGSNPALPDFNLNNSTVTRCESARAADTPGPIVGAVALDRSVILYKERSVYMINDDGSGMIQQVLSSEVGALCENAVVDMGGKHVFIGHNDFYFIEGQAVQTLPNPCKEYLLGPGGDLDKSKYFGVRGQHNREQTCVYWHYPSVDYASFQYDADEHKPVCDKWICWNYSTDTWTRGTGIQSNAESTTSPSRVVSVGAIASPDLDSANTTTYLGFGDEVTNAATSVDPPLWATNFAVSWTSSVISGPTNRNAAFFHVTTKSRNLNSSPLSTSKPLYALSGREQTSTYALVPAGSFLAKDPLPNGTLMYPGEYTLYKNNLVSDPDFPIPGSKSVIRSGDFGDGINLKFVRGIRPRFVGNLTPTEVVCSIYVRQNLSDDWELSSKSYAGTAELSSSSPYWFSVRSNSRYHQFEFSFTGLAELSGYDIDYDDSGVR